jgi:hypothetical protein
MGYLKTLTEAETLLFEREPFTTGTLSAKIIDSESGRTYHVFSYNTEIAVTHLDGRPDTWLTPSKYSQTTSRHLNIVKRAWAI